MPTPFDDIQERLAPIYKDEEDRQAAADFFAGKRGRALAEWMDRQIEGLDKIPLDAGDLTPGELKRDIIARRYAKAFLEHLSHFIKGEAGEDEERQPSETERVEDEMPE